MSETHLDSVALRHESGTRVSGSVEDTVTGDRSCVPSAGRSSVVLRRLRRTRWSLSVVVDVSERRASSKSFILNAPTSYSLGCRARVERLVLSVLLLVLFFAMGEHDFIRDLVLRRDVPIGVQSSPTALVDARTEIWSWENLGSNSDAVDTQFLEESSPTTSRGLP